MTEENYKYRTSPLFLRNQFKGKGKLQIPVIPKFQIHSDDFNDLLLIGFDKISTNDTKHFNRMIHFFLYDYRFERVWKKPDTDLEKLKCYRAVLSPDFSMYVEMAPVLQLYNTFRNRWCGAYFASKGIRVVPTISWGNENTFEFCFDGIEKGSTVAVSTYMVSEHDNRQDQKDFFLKGYNEMLRRIEPEKIICYNTPFPEMQGDIVFVDYDRCSWRYMNDDPYVPSKYAKYICREEPLPTGSDLIIKNGYVVNENNGNYNSIVQAGMGSAYGGQWKPSPNKPMDQRFLGQPGEIKVTYNNKGEKFETKIGDEGRAIKERHNTDHNRPDKHSNPHDHNIDWSNGYPDPGSPINYPDGAPEFKSFLCKELVAMCEKLSDIQQQNLNFQTISEFKWCMKAHGELEFVWNNKSYSITHPNGKISLCQGNHYAQAFDAETPDEILNCLIDGIKLRDIITRVKVIDRTV